MDVVRKIAPVDPSRNGPPGDAIETITIIKKVCFLFNLKIIIKQIKILKTEDIEIYLN